MADTTKVHPDCPNASNPYHQCGQYCTQKISESSGRNGKKNSGPILLNAPKSFDRRIKEPKTQPKPREGFVAKPEQNGKRHSSSEIVPSHDHEGVEDNNVVHKPEQNGKLHSPSHDPEAPAVRSMSFNFSGIAKDSEDTDSEDLISMISDHDARVWVGKYNVKSSIGSTLQAIFSKHGDIAAKCQLESLALRAYYLECVCYIVQELQSTPSIELTNAKIKEIHAILKDVESVQINVGWLRRVLDEIIEIIEPIALHRALEAVKGSVQRELEAQKEDLAAKEKEVGDVKVRIAETEARLSQVEVELSESNEVLSMKRSKVESFDFKALIGELV